jgi:hypothetical protein
MPEMSQDAAISANQIEFTEILKLFQVPIFDLGI